MTDYRPIPCELYAELELAVLRRHWLRVGWRDQGQEFIATLTPRDLVTKDHEEYLVALTPGGDSIEIRLDRIVRFESLNSSSE